MKKNTERVLEVTIDQLKEREKHINHLNLVLQAIRNVNQLITFEKDKEKLLQGVCDCLTETRGYKHAWVVQLDNSKHVVGMEGSGFSTSIKSFSDRLFQGQLSPCMSIALTKPEVVVIEDRSTFCGDCPLLSSYPNTTGMVIRLAHEGRLYGFLGVSLQTDFLTDTDEKSLFKEVATDIGYALHNIRIEEKHKRVVEELKYSETKYRYLFDNSSIGVGLTTIKGEVLEGNRRILDILGFTQEEFKAQGLGNIYHDLSDRGKILEIISEAGFVRDFELKLKRKNGEVFDSIVNMDLLEMEGEKILLSTLQDITDRKIMEERLKQYSVQLEEMVEQRTKQLKMSKNVQQAINAVFQQALTCDTEAEVGNTCLKVAEELTESKFGFIGLLNKKGLFDTTAISDPGFAACKLPGSDQITLIKDMTLSGIDRSTMLEGESRIVNDPNNHPERRGVPKGHPPIISFLGVPLKLEGKTIGMIGLANKEGGYQDTDQESIELLTVAFVEALKKKQADLVVIQQTIDLKEAQEKILRKEKLAVLGQLAGGIGHELRNPLGAIKNSIYFLNMVLENPEPDIKESLQIINDEVDSSERIINSLLDYARPKPMNFQETKIFDVIQKSLSITKIPSKITIKNSILDELPLIQGDPNQLTQVFSNLIFNAVQAMPEGGDLHLSAEYQKPGLLTIFVQDTGVGIPENNIERLFEPLYTTKAKGIGLGLPISKTIIEKHLGTISVESTPGKGTTFTIKFSTHNKENI